MRKGFVLATLVCGGLDIGYAIITNLVRGGSASAVLHSVASGPFGNAVRSMGYVGAALGLLVHFFIMAVMVAVYFKLQGDWRVRRTNPWVAGSLYGLILYAVMYFIILPLRWPAHFPDFDPSHIAESLFPHIFLVGLPMAFIAKRASALHVNQPEAVPA